MFNEALVFTIGYIIIILALVWEFIIKPLLKTNNDIWIYGTCHKKLARKHKINKNVQFILWKAGEQGHKQDFWIDFDNSWWYLFEEHCEKEVR